MNNKCAVFFPSDCYAAIDSIRLILARSKRSERFDKLYLVTEGSIVTGLAL